MYTGYKKFDVQYYDLGKRYRNGYTAILTKTVTDTKTVNGGTDAYFDGI